MKDRVNRLEGELRHQQALIAVEQSRLHRLRAEWAMLEQPGRIARLAAAHLQLRPAQPTQIMTIADLPRRGDLEQAGRACARCCRPGRKSSSASSRRPLPPAAGLHGRGPAS